MRKYRLIIFLFLSLILVSCKENDNKNTQNETANNLELESTIEKKPINELGTSNQEKNTELFAEGDLKHKEFSNITAKLNYIEDDSYELKIRIEQKDDIIFTTDNQNVYADIEISSVDLDNNGIEYQKDIHDKSLYTIPLENNKMPNVTEILIDNDSNLLSKEEHNAIINKDETLGVSVQIRDPQGFILEISNTIFEENEK